MEDMSEIAGNCGIVTVQRACVAGVGRGCLHHKAAGPRSIFFSPLPNTLPSPTEQLEIVQRMHRSYRFLQAQHFGLMSGITG